MGCTDPTTSTKRVVDGDSSHSLADHGTDNCKAMIKVSFKVCTQGLTEWVVG